MIDIQKNVPLRTHTTLNVGGPAEFFVVVRTKEELAEALAWAREHEDGVESEVTNEVTDGVSGGVPVTVLGGGSNVLISDEGLRGLVIKNEITGITVESEGVGVSYDSSDAHGDTSDDTSDDTVLLKVGAGVVFDDLVAHTVENGWWGLENLSHIPGSVGATPIQNVGAYGVEVGDCIVRVDVVDAHTGEQQSFDTAECTFQYRNSFFKTDRGKRFVVTDVVFSLQKHARPILTYRDLAQHFADNASPSQSEVRSAVIAIRAKKFPDWHEVGTAGSFFKNPIITKERFEALQQRYPDIPHYIAADDMVKIPLGWVLDKVLNLKGAKEGAVEAYEAQALVLINTGDATARDIDTFAKKIEANVFDATGIVVEREVTMLQ